ncbi:uncharacterized protein G2W53_019411 [Senna tora]|uniref:Uncharacterized protein n=1 Tax=Senna tora TaxID=362788 RepID=A0A834WMB4_9FABA|nr:uncharacterized protein G2W53_019411 [Senna tora]
MLTNCHGNDLPCAVRSQLYDRLNPYSRLFLSCSGMLNGLSRAECLERLILERESEERQFSRAKPEAKHEKEVITLQEGGKG